MFEMLHCTILPVSMTANSSQKQSVCLLVCNCTTQCTIFFLCLWLFKQGLQGPGVNMNIWMASWMALRTKEGQKALLCCHPQADGSYQPIRDKLVIYQQGFESLLLSQTNLHTRKAQLQKKNI